jgi:hypothetical protein
MATVDSTIVAKQVGTQGEKLMPREFYGRVRVAAGTYTGKSTDAAGTVIRLARLPKGARLLPQSKVYFAAGQGATTTVKVGDEKDDDRYFAAAAPGASAVSKELDADALTGYVLTEEMYIILTTGVAALADDVLIGFVLFWVLD